jgi:C4-dicarboxylate-specific signal transduction histidine kinase
MARMLGQCPDRSLHDEGCVPPVMLCQQRFAASAQQPAMPANTSLTAKALAPDSPAACAVAAVVHELRQPLSSMLCNIQASIRWLDRDEPQVDEALRGLRDSAMLARQMSQISSALLHTYSQRQMLPCTVQLDSVMAEVMAGFADELAGQRIAVDLQVEPGCSVHADSTQLYLVLRNLVSNAIDAISAHPLESRQISLAAYPMAEKTLICVMDSGPGITESYQAFISEPFFTTKADGMGMGLAICETILSRYDTALRHTISRRGETIFMFALPRAKA